MLRQKQSDQGNLVAPDNEEQQYECRDSGDGSKEKRNLRQGLPSLPWYFHMGATFFLVNMVATGSHKGRFGPDFWPKGSAAGTTQVAASDSSLQGDSGAIQERRLAFNYGSHVAPEGAGAFKGNYTAHGPNATHIQEVINVTVPCLGFYAYKDDSHDIGVGGLISPCGKLPIKGHGMDVTWWPFGQFHIPGRTGLQKWAGAVDENLNHWVWIVAILFFWADLARNAVYYFQPWLQPDYFDEIKDLTSGNLAPPDGFLTEEEVADWKATRLAYDSGNFIVKGNIFRVLAVFEPQDPNVGWVRWWGYFTRGVLTAYMQLYLPYSMIMQVLDEWTCMGTKSVFWFAVNAGEWVIMFIALAELANVFFQRAKGHFISGAKSNNFILSHKAAFRGNELPEYMAMENGQARIITSTTGDPDATHAALNEATPEWAVDRSMFRKQQYFWCYTSMAINFIMSLALPAVFLMRIATYTGDIASVAIEITSLYFVVDLDRKIMETDGSLQTRFRYLMKRQLALGQRPEEDKPKVMMKIVGVTQLLLDFSVKYMLLFSLATSWQNNKTGQLIGAHPFV